jgi:thiol:disulfide interchange protein
MEFEKCNPIFLASIIGAVFLGALLILTHQDGFLLKGILFLLGVGVGIPLPSKVAKE